MSTYFTGRVLNSETKARISGVKVTLDMNGKAETVHTDSEGFYQFNVLLSAAQVSARVHVEVEGYEKYNRIIVLSSSDRKIEEIHLTPINKKTNQSLNIIGIITLIGIIFVGVINIKHFIFQQQVSPEVAAPTFSTPRQEKVEIKILVQNTNNKIPVKNADVRLIVSNGSPETKRTDDDGYTSFSIPKGVKVQVSITKEGFQMKNITINETIDPNEVKIYYLTPENNISLKQPFLKPSSSEVNSLPTPRPSSQIINPPRPVQPSSVETNVLPQPKPSPVEIRASLAPKPLPTEATKQSEVSQNKYSSLELELLNKFQIDIFFSKENGKSNLANDINKQLKNNTVKAKIVIRDADIETLRKAANIPPDGFEIRVDNDEIAAGQLLVNILKDLYPNIVFNLRTKNSHRHTDNYMSIFLDTFPDEYRYEDDTL